MGLKWLFQSCFMKLHQGDQLGKNLWQKNKKRPHATFLEEEEKQNYVLDFFSPLKCIKCLQ